jgi:Uma2 family endonuclease
MATSATTTLTLEEFLALPEQEEDGTHYELDEGELIRLSPTGQPHSRRVDKIYRYLVKHLSEEQWDLMPGELGFIMASGPKPTVRGADLAIMPHREEVPEGMSRQPAHLIVEVVSPRNTPDDIERKRIQYLNFGVQEVWVVYEKARTMHVYLNPEVARRLKRNEMFVATKDTRFESSLGFPVVVAELLR